MVQEMEGAKTTARTAQLTQSSPRLTGKTNGGYFLDRCFGIVCHAAMDN